MTILPDTNTIDLERDGGWLTIWFNQPEKRNALTDELRDEVLSVFKAIYDDRSIRGVTLRGRGGVFCAGGDMKQFRSDFQTSASLEDIRVMSRDAAAIMDAVSTAPQVTVVLIEGAAMAGGFGLMCCADVAIAEASAKFAMTETHIGLSPAQIAPFVIQKIGLSTARRLMLTGERHTGETASGLGLVDFVGADVSELQTIERDIRSRVLKGAPEAIASTKALIRDIQGLPRAEVIEAAADLFARQMKGEEARDGVASFFEKRPARWVSETGGVT